MAAQVALPLTYADLVMNGDLDPFCSETTSDLQNLIQDVGHIIEQTLGSNLDDPTRGVGIQNYLSGTQDNFNTLPGVIESQLLTDDRIDTVACQINQEGNGDWLVLIQIGVNGTIIPLQFGYSSAAGLINQTP